MSLTISRTGTILLLCAVSLVAQRFSVHQGDFWTGGEIGFASIQAVEGNTRLNFVKTTPITRYFPFSNVCIGPRLSWTGEYMGTFTSNNWGLGGEIGVVGRGVVLPYCLISPHMLYSFGSSPEGSASTKCFWLPCTAGLIVPLTGSIGVELEFGYATGFQDNGQSNAFAVGAGLCGLAGKTILSIINTVSLMTTTW